MRTSQCGPLKRRSAAPLSGYGRLPAGSLGHGSPVFSHIRVLAQEAEDGLAEFQAATTSQDKFHAFARIEKKRLKWLAQMKDVQSTITLRKDMRGEGTTGHLDCQFFDVSGDEDASCSPSDALDSVGECLSVPFDLSAISQLPVVVRSSVPVSFDLSSADPVPPEENIQGNYDATTEHLEEIRSDSGVVV